METAFLESESRRLHLEPKRTHRTRAGLDANTTRTHSWRSEQESQAELNVVTLKPSNGGSEESIDVNEAGKFGKVPRFEEIIGMDGFGDVAGKLSQVEVFGMGFKSERGANSIGNAHEQTL